jgi:hypothetical protein
MDWIKFAGEMTLGSGYSYHFLSLLEDSGGFLDNVEEVMTLLEITWFQSYDY